jgi:hypothetical protein
MGRTRTYRDGALIHTLFEERADEEETNEMQLRLSRLLRTGVVCAATLAMLFGGLQLMHGPASAQDNALVGDFTAAITHLQVPTDVANGSMAIGRWHLSFLEDGTYVLERLDLGVLVTGTYTVDGDQLTVTDESGLLSCSNAAAGVSGQEDVETATYTFDLDSGNLKLSPVTDGCPLRRVIFATNDFTVYVACLTADLLAESSASPVASPVSTDDLDDLATPIAIGHDPEVPIAAIEPQIDKLLAQMTSCWATGDPQNFLPLLSQDFQGQFVSGTEEENKSAVSNLQAAMQLPIVWERAGDVTRTGADRAEAVVRTTAGDQEEFVRYLFVFEDGAWRWDGSAQ